MEESAMDHAALSSSSTANDDHFASAVIKGKRTKRQRAPAASSSSTASSVEVSSTTAASATEEEDMANCLILLAQGQLPHRPETAAPEKKTSAPAGPKASSASPAANAAGEFVYQCKTCDRCFPSFQALGGHRTSHKKPKTTAQPLPNGEKKTFAGYEDAAAVAVANSSVPKPAPTTTAAPSGKPRTHECSICGSEFSSGQALGGHMRRHRPIPAAAVLPKEKHLFALDLNLPAPSDDDTTWPPPPAAPVFAFESQPPPTPLVFPAAAWVDCHY